MGNAQLGNAQLGNKQGDLTETIMVISQDYGMVVYTSNSMSLG